MFCNLSTSKLNYYLKIDEIHVADAHTDIITVLGSCISVCLWDKQIKVGGMNHFIIPSQGSKKRGSYMGGDHSIRMLYEAMINKGCKQESLVAKVFGGASVLAVNDYINMGEKNTETAIATLNSLKIPIVALDVKGNTTRKIIFNIASGIVYRKFIYPINDESKEN